MPSRAKTPPREDTPSAAELPERREERERAQRRAALLAWYDEHKRPLPWRQMRSDAYAIWVSEIMCQQTRVDTVIPYFKRFLTAFPDVSSLAQASEEEVLAAWSGLGYYRRARMLQAGARDVVARYRGRVPRSVEELRSIAGIGRYTAGAIASVAFDVEAPIVDGNVARVLSRHQRIEDALGSAQSEQALWRLAEDLAQGARPGDLNQALMELGALVCTPTSPSCEACPWRESCRGQDIAERLPTPRKKRAPKRVRCGAIVPIEEGFVWLKKMEGSLFGGLWAPPMRELEGEFDPAALLRESKLKGELGSSYHQITHVLTHRIYEIRLIRLSAVRRLRGSPYEKIALSDLKERGISALTKKLIAAAG